MRYICLAGIIHDWEDEGTGETPIFTATMAANSVKVGDTLLIKWTNLSGAERELRDCPDHSPHESEGESHREMQERGEA